MSGPLPLRQLTDAPLAVERFGLVPYAEGLALQADRVERRRVGGLPDTLVLLEHPHVITLGSSATDANVLADESERDRRGIELHEAGRGGDVTYHGPGQLVGYPILALLGERRDLHAYLRALEAVLIEALGGFGIEARRSDRYTGVWVADRKIGAIGVRVSSGWITSHGFALNVDPDPSYFDAIVPCGIRDRAVTSMARELGREVHVDEVVDPVVRAFSSVFAGPGPFRTEADPRGNRGTGPVRPASPPATG